MHSHTVGAFEAFRQFFSHMITLPSKHMSIPIPPHHLCHTWTAQRPSLPQLSPLHLPLSPFLSTYHTTHASLAFVTNPPQCKAFCPRLLLIPSSLDTHASAWICLNEASRTWHRVHRGGCLPITCCAKRFAEQASSLFSCAHLHLSKTAAGLPHLWLAIAL